MHTYPDSRLKVVEDWRYSNPKMQVREQALSILFKRFGSHINEDGESKYTNKSIYDCAHDWVSAGNMRTDGLVKYYEAYYTTK